MGLKKEEVDERLIPFERFMSGEVIGHKKLIRNYSAGNKQKIGSNLRYASLSANTDIG